MPLRILALPILLAAVLAGCSTNSSRDLSAAQDLCAKAQHGDRSEAALAACTKIIDESDSRRDRSGAHNFRGIIYTNLGDENAALAEFNEAVRLDPYFSGAYSNRANIYSKRGDDVRAVQSYLAALRFSPKNAMAHNNYAWHLARRGEFDKAAKYIVAAEALGDGFQALYDTQGHVFMMLGRTEEAEVAFGKAMTTGGPDLVRRYQQTLYAKGYDPGRSDGVADEATQAALSACIRDNCRLLLD